MTNPAAQTAANDVRMPPKHPAGCDCDACLIEAPPTAQWDPGAEPSWLRRFLIRIAGVDPVLARICPIDEQRQIARVGTAVFFGVNLQVLLVFTASVVILGTGMYGLAGAAMITAVICGVLYAYDTLFVAGDWITQGVAYAWEYGIPCAGGKPVKRLFAVGMRWAMSGFIASTLAVFVLIRLFAPDIANQWAEDNRVANSVLTSSAIERYDTLVADLRTRLTRSDSHLDTLATERAQILQYRTPVPGGDKQEAYLAEQLRLLEARKSQVDALEAEYRASATAELAGAKLHTGNTGQQGDGPKHKMYKALADQQAGISRTQDAAIQAAKRELAEFRSHRDSQARQRAEQSVTGLAELNRQLQEEAAARASLARELHAVESNGAAWITAQVRANPQYVLEKAGLTASVQTLWYLVETHPGLAALVLGLKISIIFLETAGMLAKAFFTQCRVYSLHAALRADDSCQTEAEKRETWTAWRVRRRQRRDEIMEPIFAAHVSRAHARRGANMANAYWDQMAAKAASGATA